MTLQRQREVEDLARTLLTESVSIGPHTLAERAKVTWFIARDVLQALVRRGQATALPTGHFVGPNHTATLTSNRATRARSKPK